MENPKVKFRRGGSNLPETLTDGCITLDMSRGNMYVDTASIRKAITGTLFGITDENSGNQKTVSIDGVSDYFDGMTITVVFRQLDKENYGDLQIGISVTCGETALPYVGAMAGNSVLKVSDIEEGIPYTFVFYNGAFFINTGIRPKWGAVE